MSSSSARVVGYLGQEYRVVGKVGNQTIGESSQFSGPVMTEICFQKDPREYPLTLAMIIELDYRPDQVINSPVRVMQPGVYLIGCPVMLNNWHRQVGLKLGEDSNQLRNPRIRVARASRAVITSVRSLPVLRPVLMPDAAALTTASGAPAACRSPMPYPMQGKGVGHGHPPCRTT
jgi:hypothetical protein